ncbi:MAG: hypothetical protein Q9187_002478 [Circinaria calcarea]
MLKRKRDAQDEEISPAVRRQKSALTLDRNHHQATPTTIQIITGSYERVLHGITASIPQGVEEGQESEENVEFSDTFLFNAHNSAIRCLALSPVPSSADRAESHKVILASGSTDERINLYHISAFPPPTKNAKGSKTPILPGTQVMENPRNKELGSLLHHSSSITALYFPTKSKLLSAAEDNTIAISRTRDWAVLSTIKAPIPKAVGRPSGDTAPLGGTPAGVSDFAVHPSMKLMISVGKGEKCMRLWNLVTGKKAGVLSFDRTLLQDVGEGKWGSGEGRKVEWNSEGNEFVVAFEKGAVIFGMDSKPKCRIMPSPPSKVHQLHYIAREQPEDGCNDILAVSTEDGRLLLYSIATSNTLPGEVCQETSVIPTCEPLGQLGGVSSALTRRIKDFEVLRLPKVKSTLSQIIIVAGSSDGSIRLWSIIEKDLDFDNVPSNGVRASDPITSMNANGALDGTNGPGEPHVRHIGQLLGTYQTGNRITCLKAFVMRHPSEDLGVPVGGELPDEFEEIEGSSGSSSV